MVATRTGSSVASRFLGLTVALLIAVALVIFALSAARLLPQFRNPFAQTTTVTTGPVLLKSITPLSKYEAASGSFQVVVDLSRRSSIVPTFLEGTQTLFVGVGTDIAFVDFSHLTGKDVIVSANAHAVTLKLPHAQLEPATLNVHQSYVFAQQQGLLTRVGAFFSGNPNDQQQLYIVAQQKIQNAAQHSPLLAQAEANTRSMLTGLMRSLGFRTITVIFGAS